MSQAQVTVEGVNGRSVAAVAFTRALRDRARGRAVDACASWARLESEARSAGALHLAIQAGAERSLTLTWTGALSVAGVLCEQLLEELTELEREPERLLPLRSRRPSSTAGAAPGSPSAACTGCVPSSSAAPATTPERWRSWRRPTAAPTSAPTRRCRCGVA